jgi:hypothetical protein
MARRGHQSTVRAAITVTVVALSLVVVLPASAFAQSSRSDTKVGRSWLSRLDRDLQISEDLALSFAKAAVAEGLRPGQAARMLSDSRFASAVGSPNQAFEALIEHPDRITRVKALLSTHDYAVAGSDSLQNALMEAVPALRNVYLKDLGLRAVKGPTGVLVLVDIQTGRQVLGHGMLGALVRAPGGGPLPSPAISPEDPADASRADISAVPPTPDPLPGPWKIPGKNDPNRGLLSSPFVLLGPGLFLFAWSGYALVALKRRLRRHWLDST